MITAETLKKAKWKAVIFGDGEGGEGDEPPALPDGLNPPQKVCGE